MKNTLTKVIGVTLISLVLAGCNNNQNKADGEKPKHKVQVVASDGGSVIGKNNRYTEGQFIKFQAIPNDGFYFAGWSDGVSNNPRIIEVGLSDIKLIAFFKPNPTLTISAEANGKVNTEINGRYSPSTPVLIIATPDSGLCFSQWSDSNYANTRTIIMGTNDLELTAQFGPRDTTTVDLGLKSGTRWAVCNLGAANPWNYGDYYAWGETETKSYFSWENYKYCDGSDTTMTKYCIDAFWGKNGFTDSIRILDPYDDAATIVTGAEYSMPTAANWRELNRRCYWVWTSNYKGRKVNGYIVYKAKTKADRGKKVLFGDTPSALYSLDDTHIFLPAAGSINDSHCYNDGEYGIYLSASLRDNSCYCCYLKSDYVGRTVTDTRCYGRSVRPVRK